MKRASISTFDILVANFNKTLQNDVLEKRVSKQFTQYGETKGFFVKENNQGKYVVVKYLSEPDAERAVTEANGMLLDGLPVLVKRMEKRPTKPPGAVGAVQMTGAPWTATKDRPQFGKNPDIVPTVEPMGSASPGPDGEALPPAVAPMASFSGRGHAPPITMYVTHIETPTLLWCQELQEHTQQAIKDLQDKLTSVCPAAPKVAGRPDNTKVYASKFSEDEMWYRCQVKFAFTHEKLKVQYLDYGNCEEINPKELVELPVDLATLKPFAEKVMMHNTRFLGNTEKEAIQFLKETIGDKESLVVHPTFRLPDGSGMFAQLFAQDINLNQALIDNGFAVTKPPKQSQQLQQQQLPPGHGDGPPGQQFHLGDGGGYTPGGGRGFGDAGGGFRQGGKVGGRQVLGDPDMRMGGPRFGAPGGSRGGLDKAMLGDGSGQAGPAYSDLKIELMNKGRMMEKASMELSATQHKIKGLQTEYQMLAGKLEENNIATQLKSATYLTEKVRRLRSQFSDDKPTAVDEAIELACSADKLTESSVASLSPLMATLTSYRKMQQEICQIQNKEELSEDKLEERDTQRRTLFEELSACIKEMDGIAFTERSQSIRECTEKLMTHYDNFFNAPVESASDLNTIVTQYEEFKTNKRNEFEQTRINTDQQKDLTQGMLTNIGKKLSLSASDACEECDLDLTTQLKQFCGAMQQEISSKSVEGSTDAHFISALVQTIHRDLKAEILCINNFLRLQTEFGTMRCNIEAWLNKKPTADKLLEARQNLRSLKSKLRHKLADKHDAEENEDKEMLDEVQKEVAGIQREIHDSLLVEDKELAELALLVDSHFPEFLVLHSDCGLDVQLKYKGLVKASHEVSHYNLTPVPGSNARLFFSKFADEDVIVMECLLSDGHHLGREDFLSQLMAYTSITHPTLVHPSAVFFDKNNRHAYLRFDRGRGEILANHIEYAKPGPDDNHVIVRSVGESLAALHTHKVLHGEVNPYSVLHFPDGTATLLPPDLSCRPGDRARNKYVSPNGLVFMAPEMVTLPAGVEPTGVVDMYCVGVLILYLSCPREAAPTNPDGTLDWPKIRLDSSVVNLAKSLTSPISHLRPTSEMLLQSHYVCDVREDSPTPQHAPAPQHAQFAVGAEQDIAASTAAQLSALASMTTALPSNTSAPMPAFSMPDMQLPPPIVNFQQPPPPLPSSAYPLTEVPPFPPSSSQTPPLDAFSGMSMAEPQQFAEPGGFSSARQASPFSTASTGGVGSSYDSGSFGSSAPSGFDAAPSGFELTTAVAAAPPSGFESAPPPPPGSLESASGGFEEAALQQEQQEKENRGPVDPFESSPDSGLASGEGGGGNGEFEIGTFSIDDVNGASSSQGGDNARGRRITRQPSNNEGKVEEEGGGDKWEDADDKQGED